MRARAADTPFQQVHCRAADKARHKAGGRFLVHFHRRANLLGDAFVHHHHALGEGHGFDLIVGHVQGGGVQATVQLLQLKTHLHAQLGVEVRQRLVEEEYRRIAHDGAPHCHALALAAGELARAALQQSVQLENACRFFHALVDMAFAHAADFQPPGHVLFHAHVRIEGVVLEHHRDASVFRLHLGDALTVNPDIPGGHALQPRHHAQQGGFATAGRADHHDEFSVRHVERQRLNNLGFAIPAFGYCLKF